MDSLKQSEVLSFPVPWGVIEAKCWGSKSGRPFLGLHGWLDNANTFDKLAPLLPNDTYLVAIDLPGHGKSSRRPPGVPYTYLNWVLDVKWVISQLGWKTFSMIGHSMGAGIAAFYAGTFPDELEELILLEFRGPVVAKDEDASKVLAACANYLVSNQYGPRVYPSFEAAVSRLLEGNPDLSEESAKILAERSIYNVENGVALNRDSRLKYSAPGFRGNYMILTQSYVSALVSNIKCDVLVVSAVNCHIIFRSLNDQLIHQRLEQIKKTAKSYEQCDILGNHFVHLNNPGVLAQKIQSFIDRCKHKSKL